MVLKMRLGAVALICACAGGLSITPVEPVRAQGFFDGLFGASRYQQRPERGRYDRRGYSYGAPSWWGGSPQPQTPPPQVYVSSPKYYTYEPDTPARVSFAELAEVETAAAGPLGPPTAETPFTAARPHLATFELSVLPEVGEAIKQHYARYPDFIWIDGDHVNSRTYSAFTALGNAAEFGLSPRDYLVDLPKRDPAASDEEWSTALIEFDLAMSASVLTYILDANRGRIDPNRISGYHDFKRKTVDLTGALLKIAAETDVGATLAAQSPDNAAFRALAAELEKLRQAGSTRRIEIAEGTFLKPGGSSPELANIVAAIRLSGSQALKDEHQATLQAFAGGADYTPELVALVRTIQREKGLVADGIIGKNTIRALVPESNEDKIRKIELAMERLRWLPREFGARHVFINQPAFTATYFEEGRDPLSMRIVVGKKSNQTNFFMDEIETVEYNPYWGVPRSIIVNEMLPKLYADPTYLDRAGYEVTTSSGQRVSSSSVNWGAIATKQASVDVRQPPGRSNALGAVKILFPNSHAIYMHDTPQKNLFDRDSRAFSHGCVRLHAPREMAAAVLGKSVDYVNERIAQGRNDSDDLEVKIPVYVSYFTAWPDPGGVVHYYGDVYDRDDYLVRALERTDSARHAEG